MQLKLFKRTTVFLIVLIAITAGVSLFLWTNKSLWETHSLAVYFGLMFFILIAYFAISYYETNADRNIIRKMVQNGEIALARINEGKFERFGRDSRFKKYVFWKLDVTIYDENLNQINTTMIEKFNIKQTKIPRGNVYVTYNKEKPDVLFIIPNALISVFPELQPKVEKYEKNIKTQYLNSYYNNGMLLETFKDSMKEAK